MCISLCCLGSPGALLLDHNRLLALQDGTGTTEGSLGKQNKTQIMMPQALKYKHQPDKSSYKSPDMIKSHHAQVLPVLVLADDVPQAVEGGARVLVDGDLLVRAGRLVLTCATSIQM